MESWNMMARPVYIQVDVNKLDDLVNCESFQFFFHAECTGQFNPGFHQTNRF